MAEIDLLKSQVELSSDPVAELLLMYRSDTSGFNAEVLVERLGIDFFNTQVFLSALTLLTSKEHTASEKFILEEILVATPPAIYINPEFLSTHAKLLTQKIPNTLTDNGPLEKKDTPLTCLSAVWLVAAAIQKSFIIKNIIDHPDYRNFEEPMADNRYGPLNSSGLKFSYGIQSEEKLDKAFKIYEKDIDYFIKAKERFSYYNIPVESLGKLGAEEFKTVYQNFQNFLFTRENFQTIVAAHPAFFSMFSSDIQHEIKSTEILLSAVKGFTESRLENYNLTDNGAGFNNFYTAQIPTNLALPQNVEREIIEVEKISMNNIFKVSLRTHLGIKNSSRAELVSFLFGEPSINVIDTDTNDISTGIETQKEEEQSTKEKLLYSNYCFLQKLETINQEFIQSPEFESKIENTEFMKKSFWGRAHNLNLMRLMRASVAEKVIEKNPDILRNYSLLNHLNLVEFKNDKLLTKILDVSPQKITEVPDSFWNKDENILGIYISLYNTSAFKKKSFADVVKRKNKNFYNADNLKILLAKAVNYGGNNYYDRNTLLSHLLDNAYFSKFYAQKDVQESVENVLAVVNKQSNTFRNLGPALLQEKDFVLHLLKTYPNLKLHQDIDEPLIYSQEIALQIVKNIAFLKNSSEYEDIKSDLPNRISVFLNKSGLKGNVVETLEALFEKRKIKGILSTTKNKIEITYSLNKDGMYTTEIKKIENPISNVFPSVAREVINTVNETPPSIAIAEVNVIKRKTNKI